MSVNIAYISKDEVNRWWAVKEAKVPDDVVVYVQSSEDDLPDLPLDALVYDLDHLPPGKRRLVVEDLADHPPARPTAVHGHNIEMEDADALRINHVYVDDQISDELLEQVLRPDAGEQRKAA